MGLVWRCNIRHSASNAAYRRLATARGLGTRPGLLGLVQWSRWGREARALGHWPRRTTRQNGPHRAKSRQVQKYSLHSKMAPLVLLSLCSPRDAISWGGRVRDNQDGPRAGDSLVSDNIAESPPVGPCLESKTAERLRDATHPKGRERPR